MDADEIERWYEDQKEKLTDNYLMKLNKIDKSLSNEESKLKKHEIVKKQYQRAMKVLHSKYEKKADACIKSNLKKHAMHLKINSIMSKIKDKIPKRFYNKKK